MLTEDLPAEKKKHYRFLEKSFLITFGPSATFLNSSKSDGRNV